MKGLFKGLVKLTSTALAVYTTYRVVDTVVEIVKENKNEERKLLMGDYNDEITYDVIDCKKKYDSKMIEEQCTNIMHISVAIMFASCAGYMVKGLFKHRKCKQDNIKCIQSVCTIMDDNRY